MRSRSRFAFVYGLLGFAGGGCREVPTVDGVRADLVAISNETTGGAFDVDGFTVRIDDGPTFAFELNEAFSSPPLSFGLHTITLGGVASNCTVAGGSAKSVDVGRGEASVVFRVGCVPPDELSGIRIVFVSGREDSSELVAMDADGTRRSTLLAEGSPYAPDVSPDGRRVAFVRGWGVEGGWPTLDVLDLDLGEVTHLPETALSARWSPDGTELLYQCLGEFGQSGICRMPWAGGPVTMVTGQEGYHWDTWPDWSPDGSRIVYVRDDDWLFSASPSIYVIDRDGLSPMPVVVSGEAAATRAVWSPSGRIAFYGLGPTRQLNGLQAMAPDGSGLATLLDASQGAGGTTLPHDWSPDGRFLLFTRGMGSGRTDIFLLRVEDATVYRITADGRENMTPTFR